MNIKPLGDRVLIKRVDAEEKTSAGLIIAQTVKQEAPQLAEVLAVGPGALADGNRAPMDVKVGDKVYFSKYSGNEIKVGDEELIIVGQSDILAIVE